MSPRPKSEFSQKLDVIQAVVHQFLRPLGFRRKGRTHNRSTGGGLRHDEWFELTGDTTALATTLVDLLARFGLPFLEQFDSYGDVLSYYSAHGSLPFQNSGRASFEAGLIAHHLGDEALSQALLEKAYAWDHKGFREHVVKAAKRIGHIVG